MMNKHMETAPVEEKFLTPGVMVMLAFMAVGLAFIIVRFIKGLGGVTNLNNQFPWGIWVAVDVATGVALAAGGFTTGAIAYIFNRKEYHAVIRPALLTAMLGYTFVVIGLFVDIGRYWNIWRPMISWNPNSVLFEVAMCVMIYSNVLYIEFIPIVIERFKGQVGPTLDKLLDFADRTLDKVLFLFIIAGVVLSCMHQSGLGALMLIAKYKMHPLWYTPILPLLFLLSAIAGGYPMVIFESLIVAKSFHRRPEMEILTPLARFMPVLIGIYLVFKLGDMFVRKTYVYLDDWTVQSTAFIVEVLFGVILPFVLVLSSRVRRSPGWLFFASTIFVLGILFNRINVFLVSYTPPYVIESYFPSVGEMFITAGLIAGLMFMYRVFVAIFPVLGAEPKELLSSKGVKVASIIGISLLGLGVFLGGGEAMAAKAKVKMPLTTPEIPSIDHAPPVRVLDNDIVNQYSDFYESVRFMHRKHANVLRDCSICHHHQPKKDGDMEGEPMTWEKFRANGQLPVKCSECHKKPFDPNRLDVPGLKGAYHRLCIECHKETEQVPYTRGPVIYSAMVRGPVARVLDTRAPTDCIACHSKKVPDHKELVKLEGNSDPLEVTKACLSCHEKEAEAIIHTAHWKWQGPTPYSVGNENRIDIGKRRLVINNF